MNKEIKLTPLQQARKAAVEAFDAWREYAKSLDAKCAEESRDVWTDEERAEYEKHESAFSEAKAKVQRVELQSAAKTTMADAEKWLDAPAKRVVPPPDEFGKPPGDTAYTRAIPALPATAAGYRTKVFTDDNHGLRANEKAYAFSLFARAVAGNEWARAKLAEFGVNYRADMSESVNTAGGALVPSVFVPDLIRLVEQYGVFRRFADVRPMSSDHMVFPVRTGGLTAYAMSENTAITESQPTYTNAEVTAKKWATLTPVSNELLADAAISVADQIATEVAQSFANTEDSCGFIGDGTSTYHGIVGVITKIHDGSHTGSVYTAITGNTAFSTLDAVDFGNMIGQLPLNSMLNPRWYISKAGYGASMARLMDSQGGSTGAELAGDRVLRFMGFEVVLTQVMNSTLAAQVSTNGLVLFGDLAAAAIMGTKSDITFAASADRFFDQDQTAFRGIERFGINAHLAGKTTTASPLISLATPGS